MQTLCLESGLRTAPNWPKIRKMVTAARFSDMTSLSIFFDDLFLLSNLVTGPSFMSISSLVLELWQFSFIRDWPEIGNTPVWVLPNIWRLGQVMDTKFGTNVSYRMLLNAANFQGYSFYRFWVIKGKPTQIRVKNLVMCFVFSSRDISSLTIYIQISMKKKVVLVSTFSSVNLFLLIEAS